MRSLRILFAAIIIIVVGINVGYDSSAAQQVLKSILVSPQGVTLEIGKNQAFTAQGKDQSNNNMNVIAIWSSSNTAVGTIDSRGIFTARGAGMTTITALSSFVKGTASVTVKAPPVLKTIIITPQNKTLEVGKTMQYNAEGKDQYNNRMNASMSWSVSDTRVGSIDAKAIFTAKREGAVIVTASSGNVKGSAKVTVPPLPAFTGFRMPFDGTYYQTQEFALEPLYYFDEYFGWHPGEDWALPIGTKVLAVSDGTVVISSPASTKVNLGYYIVIRHKIPGQIVYSGYTHVNPLVKNSDNVKKGQAIATIAKTKYGAHLHWEIKTKWDEKTRWWNGSNSKGYYNDKQALLNQGFVDPSKFVSTHK
jgi:murein DD-endopeptidase MepM/ murein hydrolase activator NlpD